SRVAGRLIGNSRLLPRSKNSVSKRVLGGSASSTRRASSCSADSPGSPTLRDRSITARTLVGGPAARPARLRTEYAIAVSVGDSVAIATRASSVGVPAALAGSRGAHDTSQPPRVEAWPRARPLPAGNP